MTFRIGMRIDGDPSGARRAMTTTREELRKLKSDANAVGIAGNEAGMGIAAIGGSVPALTQTAGALRLNQQQMMNMQFQLNDMATMLASGQSPFVLLMQQGMQIGQIFGPGATPSQALRAFGQGVMSFVTNPINLAITGTAVLAGTIPLIWQAMTGPEAASAEDVMERFDALVAGLDESYGKASDAAARFAKESGSVLDLRLQMSADELAVAYEAELDRISGIVASINAQMNSLESVEDIGFGDVLSRGEMELAGLVNQLVAGELEADQFRETMANIVLAENTEADVRSLARSLFEAADEAVGLGARLREIDRIAQDMLRRQAAGFARVPMTLELNARIDPEARDKLESELNAERQRFEREQERIAREAERAARQAEQQARQRETNAQTLADLDAEIGALSSSIGERDTLLAQLEEERQIRAEIAALGETGTAEQAEALRERIPIRNALLDAARAEEEQLRRNQQAAQQYASAIVGVGRRLSEGADAGEVFRDTLADIGWRMAEMAIMNAIFPGSGGGFGGNPLSLFFNADGNVFSQGRIVPFSKGTVIDRPTLFPMADGNTGMMGEAGDEAIMPLRRGANGRLGVEVHGGLGGSAQTAIGGELRVRLAEGLVADILSQAENTSIRVVEEAAPGIADAGARGGEQRARENFAHRRWTTG